MGRRLLFVCAWMLHLLVGGQVGFYRTYSPASTANNSLGAMRHPQKIRVHNNQGFLINGWDNLIGFETSGGTSSYVIKTDTAFVPQWRKEYTGVLSLPTGGIIFYGFNYIEKVSANGSQVWIKSLPDSLLLNDAVLEGSRVRFVGLTKKLGPTFNPFSPLILSNGFTLLTDTNGNYVSNSLHHASTVLSNGLTNYYAQCDFAKIKKDPSGNYYLLSTFYRKQQNHSEMAFVKMDSAMNFLYGKTWNSTSSQLFLKDLGFFGNGRSIGVGYTNNGATYSSQFRIVLTKMDAQGSILNQLLLPTKTYVSDLHVKQNGHYVVGLNRDDSCFLMEFDTALVINWCRYLGQGKNTGGVIEHNQRLYYTTYDNGPVLRSYDLNGNACSSYTVGCAVANGSIALSSFSLVPMSFTPSLTNQSRDTLFTVTYTNSCVCNAIVPTLSAINCVNSPLSATGIGYGPLSWYSQATGPGFLVGGPTFNYVSSSPTVLTVYLQDSTCTQIPTRVPVSFTVSGYPQLTYSPASNTICQGSSLVLQVSGAGNFLWHHNQSHNFQQVLSPSITTQYTVTATNAPSCSIVSTLQIVVTPTPNPIILLPQNSCTNQSVTLQATGANQYQWNTGNTTSSFVFTPTSTTPVNFTLTGTNGMCSKTKTATLQATQTPSLSIQSSTNSACINSAYVLNATGASTYSWSTGQLTPSLSFLPQALTIFTVTGWHQQCFSKITHSVIGVPIPTLQITPTTTLQCVGTVLNLQATGANGYWWANGPQNATHSITIQNGINSYTVFGANKSCIASKSILIQGVPFPTLTVTSSSGTLCAGNSYTLNASGASQYSWSNGSTGTSIIITPTASINLHVTGKNSHCASSQILNLTVYPKPALSITGPSVICLGEPLPLTVTGAPFYQWQNGSNDSSRVFNPSGSGSVYVKGTTANGCTSQTFFNYSVNACEGILEPSFERKLVLYPNPTTGTINFKTNGWSAPLDFELFNMNGQLMASYQLNPSDALSIDNFPSGVYILHCQTNGQILRVIKTN